MKYSSYHPNTIQVLVFLFAFFSVFSNSTIKAQSLKKTFEYLESDNIVLARYEVERFTADIENNHYEFSLYIFANALIINNPKDKGYNPYNALNVFWKFYDLKVNTPKVNKFLNKYNFSIDGIKKAIYANILSEAKSINNVDSYKKAYSVCISCYYESEVLNLMAKAAYKQAITLNNIQLYKSYLEEYPYSIFLDDIKIRLNKAIQFKLFEDAYNKTPKTVEGIDTFIENFNQKDNPFLSEAERLRDSLVIANRISERLRLAQFEREKSLARKNFVEIKPRHYQLKSHIIPSSFMVSSDMGLITEFYGNNVNKRQLDLNIIHTDDNGNKVEFGGVNVSYQRYKKRIVCNAIESAGNNSSFDYTHYFLAKSSFDKQHYLVFTNFDKGFIRLNTHALSIKKLLEIDDKYGMFNLVAIRRLSNNNILIVASIENTQLDENRFHLNASEKSTVEFLKSNEKGSMINNSFYKMIVLSPEGNEILKSNSYLFTGLDYIIGDECFYLISNSNTIPVPFKYSNKVKVLKEIPNIYHPNGDRERGISVTKFSNNLNIINHEVLGGDYNPKVNIDKYGSSFINKDKLFLHTINYKFIMNSPYEKLYILDKNNLHVTKQLIGKKSEIPLKIYQVEEKTLMLNLQKSQYQDRYQHKYFIIEERFKN